MELELTFDEAWVEAQRAGGVRATRKMEKWVAARPGTRLKTVFKNTLVVLVEDVPEFIADLERTLEAEFHESSPRSVFSFREAGSGGGEPSRGKTGQKPEPLPEPLPDRGAKEAGADGVGEGTGMPEALVERLSGRVPFSHSPELLEYLRETVRVVPALRRMDALQSFWRQHVLLSIDDGYGLTQFLKALPELHAASPWKASRRKTWRGGLPRVAILFRKQL